jgi:hypothetical protein
VEFYRLETMAGGEIEGKPEALNIRYGMCSLLGWLWPT